MNELIAKNDIDPVAIFTGNGLDALLHEIEQECLGFEADLSTKTSRKQIASLARKISSSKVVIDNAGKELVAEWKSKAKLVDASRKEARDFLDSLKERIRKPLTDWELVEEKRAEKERLDAEIFAAYEKAIQDDILFEKEKELAERERKIKEDEEAQRIKIQAENAERERLVREASLKKQAAEDARLKAEQAAQDKIDTAKREEIKAKLAVEKAELDRLEAIAKAEQDKKDAVLAAELKAKQEAERIEIQRLEREAAARLKADLIEEKRLKQLADEQAEADRLAADKNHRRTINQAAHKQLIAFDIDSETAKKVITLIAGNRINNISINYYQKSESILEKAMNRVEVA